MMGLYCLLLPHTPPKGGGQPFSLRGLLGLDALSLMRERSFAVFVAGSFLLCIPLQFYYTFTNLFLNEIGVSQAASKMTLGQGSEILFMLAMPFFLTRVGLKGTLLIGMAAWVMRYLLFAWGDGSEHLWMLLGGILLHGICYDFFFVAGQVYVDRKAPVRVRAAAQGFIALVTLGLGMFVGARVSGLVVQHYSFRVVDGAVQHHWGDIWMVPAVAAAVGSGAVCILLPAWKGRGRGGAQGRLERYPASPAGMGGPSPAWAGCLLGVLLSWKQSSTSCWPC